MSAFPGSPKLLKGGIVLIDPDSSVVQRIIVLRYNPDALTRPAGAARRGRADSGNFDCSTAACSRRSQMD